MREQQIIEYCTIYNLSTQEWLNAFKVYLEGKSLNCYNDMLGHILLDAANSYTLASCTTYDEESLIKERCETIKRNLNLLDLKRKK